MDIRLLDSKAMILLHSIHKMSKKAAKTFGVKK